MMDVLVEWEDQSKNCVHISDLKPIEKNEPMILGTKVKMLFKSKWYYGTIIATEDEETGEVKTLTERRQSDESESSEDNVPLSTFINPCDNQNTPVSEIKIQMNFESTKRASDQSNVTYCPSDPDNLGAIEDVDMDLSPTILQDYGETIIDHPMISCEVPDCGNDVFNSCQTCFLFLCSKHFFENESCPMHGHIVEKTVSPLNNNIHPSEMQAFNTHTDSAEVNPSPILNKIEIRNSYNTDEYIPQTCEVPGCVDEVFSSCFRCNILLCWAHFEEDISCEIHKKKEQPKRNIRSDFAENTKLHLTNNLSNNEQANDNNIEEIYAVDGLRREFELTKEKNIDKRKESKMLRNTGKQYISPATKKIIPAKFVGRYCNVANCEANNRHCYRFSEIDRKVIFANFYNTGETALKRDFILRHITECEPRQRTHIPGGRVSRRKRSLKYYFTLDGKKYQVCRTFFLNTLAVSEKFVRNSLAKPNESGILRQDTRGGRVESLKLRDNKIDNLIRNHINRFPRVESHYCRASSTKEYLHSDLSVKKMYSMLIEEIGATDDTPGLTTYKKVFKSMNLAFHRPKKDQCSLCAAYHSETPEMKLKLKEKYEKHIKEKQTVRKLKDTDKQEAAAIKPQLVCASFDLQQVMFLPITKEGAIFYKRRLSVYNFTIYNIANRDCYCFTWPETESRRGSSEIATAVSMFLHEHDIALFKSISLYADGCAGQNKNSIVASALLYCINNVTHLQTITLRFFAPNHGQNEGDSAHSAISYAVQKAGDVFLPSQLYPIIHMARSSHPYIVRPLQHTDFKDYKELSQKLKILSLRKDNESGSSINWTDVVEFKVDRETPTSLYFKTSHTDATYRSISVKRTQAKFLKEPIKPLNNSKIKISKPKYDDLISLCNGDTAIIRFDEYKKYYRSLPHE